MTKEFQHRYPNDITLDANKSRSAKILVKNVNVSDSIDALKKKVEDIKNSYTDNIFSGDDSSGDINEVLNSSEEGEEETIWGCALPLPNELNDSQSHQWETSEGAIKKLSSSITEFSLGGVSANKAAGELASLGGFRKPIVDPGYFQDYNGTEPREFSFSWDLIPNNPEEARSIENILFRLKKYSLPESTIDGIAMRSPYTFDIEIGNDKISKLLNMNSVVCKSMSINYSAEGALQFLPDGIPKYMRLEMTFAERRTVVSQQYRLAQ